MTTVKSPGPWQSIQHRVARTFGGFSMPFGMAVPSGFAVPAGGLAIAVPAGILAKRRYHL